MKNIFVILIASFVMTSYNQIKKRKVEDIDGNPIEDAYLINITIDNN